MVRTLIQFFSASILFLASFVQLSMAATPIFQGGDKPEETGLTQIQTSLEGSGVVRSGTVRELVVMYINFALPLLALAVFVGVIYAGFLYATAMGVEEQTAKAKKIFIYSAVGILIVILSYSIATLFTSQLTGGLNP